MRLLLIAFLLVIISGSCKKTGVADNAVYQELKGHWRGMNGNEQIDVYFNRSGRIEVRPEHGRGRQFKPTRVLVADYPLFIDSVGYRGHSFQKGKTKSFQALTIYLEDATHTWGLTSHFLTQGDYVKETSHFIPLVKIE